MKPLFTLSKLLLALTIVLLISLSANAQKIPFQGKLLENGEPVDGQKTLVFSIADPEWTETHENVQVTNGLYSLVLGSITDLPTGLFDGVESLSLNVSVDGTALTPVEIYAPIPSVGVLPDTVRRAFVSGDPLGTTLTVVAEGEGGDDNIAFSAVARSANGGNTGIWARAESEIDHDNQMWGVFGESIGNSTAFTYGVLGESRGDGTGVRYGLRGNVFGTNSNLTIAVRGMNSSEAVQNGSSFGAWFDTRGAGATGTSNYGVRGQATKDAGRNIGVHGIASGGDSNYAGWFDGDVQINANQMGLGKKDWEPNPERPYFSLRSTNELEDTNNTDCDDPETTDVVEYCTYFPDMIWMEVTDDGEGNEIGAISLKSEDGKEFRIDANGFDANSLGINLNDLPLSREDILGAQNMGSFYVGNDENGNDPTGASGAIEIQGTNTLNARLMGQFWENADRPVLDLYGSHGNGDGWYWENAALRVNGDGTNDWGSLELYKSAEGVDNHEQMIRLEGADGSASFTSGLLNIGRGNEAPFGDYSTLRLDNSDTDAHIELDGTGWMVIRGEDGNDKARFDSGGSGYISGDLTVDGNINGNFNVNLDGTAMSRDDILNGQNLAEFYVGNDENGNDPGGATGAIEIKGTNTLNARLMGQFWENADRPVFDLYGSHGNGDGWYWENAALRVDGDGTNDWGSLGLYKSAEGVDNHQEMIRLEGSDGSASFTSGLLNIGRGNEAPFGDYSTLRLDNSDTDAHIELDGTGWMVIRGEDGNDKARLDNSGNGFFDGTIQANQRVTGYQGVEVGDFFGTNNGAYVDENGYATFSSAVSLKNQDNSANVMNLNYNDDGEEYATLDLFNTSVDANNPTINLSGNDGSASFAGNINVGDYLNANSNLEGGGANTNNGGNINLGGLSETTEIRMYGEFIDGSSTSVSHLALDGDNGNYVYLWGSGDIDATGNISSPNITALSDMRLKENVLPLNKSLSQVMKLRGVSYNWIDGKYGKKKQIGVIAQEVEEVYPEFVHTNEEGMKSVNYSQMVAVLIEAIKELNTKITTLETENASLKASLTEVDGLKSQMKNLETLVAKLVQNNAVTTTTQQQ